MNTHTILTGLVISAALATPALAEEDDFINAQTRTVRLSDAAISDINHLRSNGYRLTDVDVEEGSGGSRFNAVLVQETGPYNKSQWWYYGLTQASEVWDRLGDNNARLTDLEVYYVNNTRHFTVLMESNTGENATAWAWYYGQTFAGMLDKIDDFNGRPVDVETYINSNGDRRFAFIMVKNTGNFASGWSLWSNVDVDFISNHLSDSNHRLVDIEKRGADTYTVISVPRQGHGWWWWVDSSSSLIDSRSQCHDSRFLDVEKVGDDLYFAIELQMAGDTCPEDIDGNGAVDFGDLLQLLAAWGLCP